MRTLAMVVATSLMAACAQVRHDTSEVVVSPVVARPLAAIAVSQCGLAVALFIQLDATHLLRADPRQSDLFTSSNGQPQQSTAGPMEWSKAYDLASTAPISSHVTIPCTDGPST